MHNKDLCILASLNLAIVFMRCQRESELTDVLMKVNPENLPTTSQSLKAAAYYIYGLHAFFGGRHNDAKRYLRETLKMANAEDLNRLTSCSLVLLGHIFYSLGNSRESMNMVTPAMQLASKIPDIHVQLWATALLKGKSYLFLSLTDGLAPKSQERLLRLPRLTPLNHQNPSIIILGDVLKERRAPQEKIGPKEGKEQHLDTFIDLPLYFSFFPLPVFFLYVLLFRSPLPFVLLFPIPPSLPPFVSCSLPFLLSVYLPLRFPFAQFIFPLHD